VATSARSTTSVPTASTCPQYGPAMTAPGANDQRAAARTPPPGLPCRHTRVALISAIATSAGMEIDLIARRRASPSKIAASSHSTYRNAGG
jgi:hypothetical protein